ncbi:MAG TPA: NifB/NifX family molybdenum-iron cluster-binding protein [Methanocorpusculum sp.]|nr:NifB/NifX family molybdenum-iron cluster-binding protein [Methanocorpusculum sp.]
MSKEIKKIAIAQDGSMVSQHFGHCMSYAMFTLDGDKLTRLPDFNNPGHEPGLLPRLLSEEHADVVLAGGMGPRAVQMFESYGIEAVLGIFGDIDGVAALYAQGTLNSGVSTCTHDDSHECDGNEEHHEHAPAPHIVGITLSGDNQDALTDMRFGRSPYFAIVNFVDKTTAILKNPYTEGESGVGPKVAQFLASQGVSVILTGKSGVNASAALKAGGIMAYEIPEAMKLTEALAKYLSHELKPIF